jgi:arginyl-tRNA synthetase
LKDGESFALVKLLNKFPETVIEAAENYEPSLITRLLIDIAQAFNKFYFAYKIITENKDESAARLALTAAVKQVIKNGLNLILIEAPDKM